MKLKIKGSTIARILALLAAVLNECLVLFGKSALPFTQNWVYQVVSLVVMIILAAINCWNNQDVSQLALLCGKIFDAFEDGKISEEELAQIIKDAEEAEKNGYTNESYLVSFANSIIKNVQKK